MARTKNKEVRFISSSIKVPSLDPCSSSPFAVPPILSALPFARLRLDCFVNSVQSYVKTVSQKLRPKLALAISDQNQDPKSMTLKEERILISEVLVRTKVSSYLWFKLLFQYIYKLEFQNWVIIYVYIMLYQDSGKN